MEKKETALHNDLCMLLTDAADVCHVDDVDMVEAAYYAEAIPSIDDVAMTMTGSVNTPTILYILEHCRGNGSARQAAFYLTVIQKLMMLLPPRGRVSVACALKIIADAGDFYTTTSEKGINDFWTALFTLYDRQIVSTQKITEYGIYLTPEFRGLRWAATELNKVLSINPMILTEDYIDSKAPAWGRLKRKYTGPAGVGSSKL